MDAAHSLDLGYTVTMSHDVNSQTCFECDTGVLTRSTGLHFALLADDAPAPNTESLDRIRAWNGLHSGNGLSACKFSRGASPGVRHGHLICRRHASLSHKILKSELFGPVRVESQPPHRQDCSKELPAELAIRFRLFPMHRGPPAHRTLFFLFTESSMQICFVNCSASVRED